MVVVVVVVEHSLGNLSRIILCGFWLLVVRANERVRFVIVYEGIEIFQRCMKSSMMFQVSRISSVQTLFISFAAQSQSDFL